jgi:hypothetical protein
MHPPAEPPKLGCGPMVCTRVRRVDIMTVLPGRTVADDDVPGVRAQQPRAVKNKTKTKGH